LIILLVCFVLQRKLHKLTPSIASLVQHVILMHKELVALINKTIRNSTLRLTFYLYSVNLRAPVLLN